MSTYVLVGGAWIGAWAWQDVTRDLRAKGHDVYPLSLTGLGERVHLGNASTNLTTHIVDVINLIEFEDLQEVVLVVHSYSGIVAPGVADRIPERLSRIVYVDTAPLPNGFSMLDLNSPEGKAEIRQLVEVEGEGWKFPVPPFEEIGKMASLKGLGEAERAKFEAKAVAHPFGTYTEPLTLTREAPLDIPQNAVACDNFRQLLDSGNPMLSFVHEPGWSIEILETGHWPMLSTPTELAIILDRLVQS
ncbi:MAG: alpha/beta hydrolase [Thermomicrobiales bacterium]